MSTFEQLFPEVAFIETEGLDLGWHGCSAYDGDDHIADTVISYSRYGGHHTTLCCSSCVSFELVELHYGNPKPVHVTVEQRVEYLEMAA